MIETAADVIVAGAGHNSLVTACYLARAGLSVLVLEARSVPGGGAVSEHLLGPEELFDTCSTGHTAMQRNPLLADDELGLIADQGLTYVAPDPIAHVVFPDGEQLTHWLDVDRTAEEIARFCAADAAAYRRLLAEWDEVGALFSAAQNTPLGFGPSLDAQLDAHPRGRVWSRRRVMSAWDVIRHEFQERHVRAYLLWQAYQTFVRPDAAGTGILVYSGIAGRQRVSWTIPIGGSGRLTDALVATLEAAGGRILCDARVTEIVTEGGRAVGVRTADGSVHRAGTAVVSTIHVGRLLEMAPRELWDEAWTYGVETLDPGTSGFTVYLSTTEAPTFETAKGAIAPVSSGYAGWPEDQLDQARAAHDGRWYDEVEWMMVAAPTVVDPQRSSAGRHTLKLLGPAGYRASDPGDAAALKAARARSMRRALQRMCPSFDLASIVAETSRGPADFEAANPAMVGGAWHGGDRSIAFMGGQRPAPGWAQHRTPIPGLYQTGATTHPGGSITGSPGRNAARVVLRDLGREAAFPHPGP